MGWNIPPWSAARSRVMGNADIYLASYMAMSTQETNIWALKKDISIKHLLLLLVERLGQDAFEIADPAQSDARAISVNKPGEFGLSAYLYTYGQDEERYGVHLEYPASEDANLSDTEAIYENLSFDRLADTLATHLDIVGTR